MRETTTTQHISRRNIISVCCVRVQRVCASFVINDLRPKDIEHAMHPKYANTMHSINSAHDRRADLG